ncbi:MAG TPA: hypothetical protein VKG92_02965 [Flavobacteriales bacterium]|nr:hypothetical protein [Flavobacteriales bacterium]
MRAFLTLATLSLSSAVFAQSPYRPFPEGNAEWVELHEGINGGGGKVWDHCIRTITFANDTIIAGTEYRQLRSTGLFDLYAWPETDPVDSYMEPDTVFVRFRDDTTARKVFIYDIGTQQEMLWFDFTLSIGDYYPTSYGHPPGDYPVKVIALDSIPLNDGYHRTWVLAIEEDGTLYYQGFCTIIEGVGASTGLKPKHAMTYSVWRTDTLLCHVADDLAIHPLGATVCDLNTSIAQAQGPLTARVGCFPNPTCGILTIGGSRLANAHYAVFDGRGVLVQQGTLRSNTIDVGALAPAPYVIRLNSPDGLVLGTVRVMKE